MITLAEGKGFLSAMAKVSKWGLVPFEVDIEKGRLSKPSWRKTTLWYLSLLFRVLYIAQQYYQMRSIYLLKEDPTRATTLHVGVGFATPLILILEVYLSAFKTDMLLLVFNDLFKTGIQDNYKRPWKSMHIDDLILRYLLPTLAIVTPGMAIFTILIIPKYLLRPIDLPFAHDYSNNLALNFMCLVLDLYYWSCVIIQLHLEVFFLLITCSKIVKDLLDARKSERYQGIVRERRILRKARGVQLYCILANHINSWITYTMKIVSLSCTIAFLYIVITQIKTNIGFSLVFLYASFLTTASYGYICYFANPVRDQMRKLRRHLTSKTSAVAVPEYKLELIASIRSLKVEPVRVARFHALERESILIFLDFVVTQLVSLLLLNSTSLTDVDLQELLI